MATHNAKANNTPATERGSGVPLVESFANNGDQLSITLNRQQWLNIVGALSIGAGQLAIQRDYDQVFSYTGVCQFIGQRLGMATTQAISGDLPPPALTRGAAAGS